MLVKISFVIIFLVALARDRSNDSPGATSPEKTAPAGGLKSTWPPDGCIRLVESTSHTAPQVETIGYLQVYYSGVWGSVCLTGTWAPGPATVACRMLGFNTYGSTWALPINVLPDGHSSSVWKLNIAYCSGTENTLSDCVATPPWLTPVTFGSPDCQTLLKLPCKDGTAFPDLISCPPPPTTTTNPTTQPVNPNKPTHNTGETSTASENESQTGGGLSTEWIIVICAAVLVAVGALVGVLVYKKIQRQHRIHDGDIREASTSGQ